MMTEQVRPFFSGSQYGDWTASNCARCTKAAGLLGPDAMPTCEIEYELIGAYIGDGKVGADIAQRMGYTSHNAAYTWPCNEVVWTEEWKAEYAQRNGAQQ